MANNMYDQVIEALKPYISTFHDRYKYSDWVVKLLVGPCIEIVILHFDALTCEYEMMSVQYEYKSLCDTRGSDYSGAVALSKILDLLSEVYHGN